MISKKNCWEFRKCCREPGGARTGELGVCPAATEIRANGVNGGKNGGRTCWAICGTMCGGTVQGTYAAKIASCRECEFYQSVHRDIETSELIPAEHPSKILDLVLERTAALEQEIEQRIQAEAALRQVNTKLNLLSSITRHDMLNKLTGIGLLMDLFSRKYAGDPGVMEYVRVISVQLKDLEGMVWFTSDYQDLGSQAPAWQNISRVAARIRSWVSAVPIGVDPGLDGYEIFADPLLGKVFYNLAENAIRHGGKVSRIRIHADVGPKGLVIFWEDDGVGVAGPEKEKIFAKGHGSHTGLGLFLAREILSITGITIRETGIPGAGARFELVVPVGAYRRVIPQVREEK